MKTPHEKGQNKPIPAIIVKQRIVGNNNAPLPREEARRLFGSSYKQVYIATHGWSAYFSCIFLTPPLTLELGENIA